MSVLDNTRDEKAIFDDLEALCQQPGYAHIIAYFCLRDNSIFSDSKQATKDAILEKYNQNRLIRNEISLLIGLMCKKTLNLELPEPKKFQELVSQTELLLKELHLSMMIRTGDSGSIEEFLKYMNSGEMLREPIFYTGDSAYHFQYRDFSKFKYSYDNDWFILNKEYSVEQLYKVISSIEGIQTEKINETLKDLQKEKLNNYTILPGYIFSIQDISYKTGIDAKTIENIINSFSFSKESNDKFECINDFNATNAYPILPLENGKFLLLQYYSLLEALYETPFFWFNQDPKYKNKAMEHRGKFTEDFSYERLRHVFGEKNVFKNIDIKDTNSNKLGEIDVLVTFGNRLIILQAKSKKLTISARAGNDDALNNDFKKAIQASYDQAVECGIFLLDTTNTLILPSGEELKINRNIDEIYPLSIISDHYPALSIQARHFLKQRQHPIIKSAFVIDIFTLDVITEILKTPLYFLSYINRRVTYGNKVISNYELTILSYHLKNNLYLTEKHSVLWLLDDIGAELDLVMLSRRGGLGNKYDHSGILAKYQGTFFDALIKDIENDKNPNVIDLGFKLLMLSETSVSELNEKVRRICLDSVRDRKLHDLTLIFGKDNSFGLTIHCTDAPDDEAMLKLDSHCELRKYVSKLDHWFGIAVNIDSSRVRFGINKIYKWRQSDEMDEKCRRFTKLISQSSLGKFKRKTGRNDNCPCGSGKKYKKCCLNK